MRKIIILIVGICFLLPHQGAAQTERLKISSAEDIAIAFYRTAGVFPDFKTWIWGRAPYKFTPLARRAGVFEEEMTRLQTAYQIFNKRRDRLVVKIPVDINPRKSGLNSASPQYHMGLTVRGLHQAHYVTYQFMEENIALFPSGLDRQMDSVIDAALYARLKHLNTITAKPFVVMVLEGEKAKSDRPYNIDDLQQWVFETKLLNMTLYTQEGDVLWDYTAPIDLSRASRYAISTAR